MITAAGSPVTGLTFSNFSVTLIKGGITVNITSLYTIAEQQYGVYRIALDSSVTGTADIDYVLIVRDLTGLALTDAVEFTLYNESIDTVKADVDSTTSVLSAKLDVVTSYTDEVEPLLKNSSYGLSALQTLVNSLSTQLATARSAIEGDISSSSNSQTVLLNQIISNQSSGSGSILTQIALVASKCDIVLSYTDEVEPLLKNTTYGLSALKTELDSILTKVLLTAQETDLVSHMSTTSTNFTNLSAQVTTAVNDVLINTNLLNIIVSYVNTLNPLLTNATYGLSALKAELDTILTNASLNTTSINSNVTSQTNITSTKVDALSTTLGTDYSNLTSQIGLIPTNPLKANDALALNLAKLDTTVSSIAVSAAQQVWSFGARYLSGTSGVNQIDVSGIDAGFLVGQDAHINVALLDSTAVAVTGRTYPGSLGVGFWRGGASTTPTGVTVQETAAGVYRTTIPGALINTPAIDYLLVVSDTSSVGTTQRVEFTAFQLTGIAGPRTVTVIANDSNTLLPIPDTQIYVKDPTNSMIINKGLTDVSGRYTTGLTDGTYKVILRKSFVDFVVPQNLTVSGDTTAVYLGAAFTPVSPTSPTTCVVYGWITDLGGTAVRNATIIAKDPSNASYSGVYKLGKTSKQTTTDSNGYWNLQLIKNSQLIPAGVPYQVEISYPGFSYKASVVIPDTSSVEFSTVAQTI
jgi:hypothetical protein